MNVVTFIDYLTMKKEHMEESMKMVMLRIKYTRSTLSQWFQPTAVATPYVPGGSRGRLSNLHYLLLQVGIKRGNYHSIQTLQLYG